MISDLKRILPLLCALALPGGYAWAATTAAGAKEELKTLRDRIDTLQKQLSSSEASRNEAADALRESERAISETNRALSELNTQSQGVSHSIAEINERSRRSNDALAAQQSVLAHMLYAQYVAGAPGPLRLMLNDENPNDIARHMHYMGYVSRARANTISELRENLARLKALAEEVTAKASELAAIVAEQATQRQRLEQQKRKHGDVLVKLSRDIQKQRQEIGTLKRNETRLTNLIDQLARIIERTPPSRKPPSTRLRNERVPEQGGIAGAFSQLRGLLALPVRGELTNRFGSPRTDSGMTWKGLFLTARPGEEVKAVAPGRVVYADWLRGFGNLLIIDHGEGYMSLYGYNEALLKRVGDSIGSGETVATVGNSGGSAESGLYFELRHQGKPFDPLTWVKMR